MNENKSRERSLLTHTVQRSLSAYVQFVRGKKDVALLLGAISRNLTELHALTEEQATQGR